MKHKRKEIIQINNNRPTECDLYFYHTNVKVIKRHAKEE